MIVHNSRQCIEFHCWHGRRVYSHVREMEDPCLNHETQKEIVPQMILPDCNLLCLPKHRFNNLSLIQGLVHAYDITEHYLSQPSVMKRTNNKSNNSAYFDKLLQVSLLLTTSLMFRPQIRNFISISVSVNCCLKLYTYRTSQTDNRRSLDKPRAAQMELDCYTIPIVFENEKSVYYVRKFLCTF